MGLFRKKKETVNRLPVWEQTSSFMSDESEGDHGKEAILDYELSWLIRQAKDGNYPLDVIAKKALLQLIERYDIIEYVEEDSDNYFDVEFPEVKVWKQWKRIDLIAEVTLRFKEKEEKHLIVIEDKAYTRVHDNQLDRYSEIVNEHYNTDEFKKHFCMVTFFGDYDPYYDELGNECNAAKEDWTLLCSEDVINLNDKEKEQFIDSYLGTGDERFDDFWLRRWS